MRQLKRHKNQDEKTEERAGDKVVDRVEQSSQGEKGMAQLQVEKRTTHKKERKTRHNRKRAQCHILMTSVKRIVRCASLGAMKSTVYWRKKGI